MSTAPVPAPSVPQKFHSGDSVKAKHGPVGKVQDAQFDAARNEWMYVVDYKGLGVKKNQPENQLSVGHDRVKAPYVPATGKDLFDFLSKVGYKLYVRQNGGIKELDRLSKEYKDWTGGETIPSSAIIPGGQGVGPGGKETTFWREWTLEAPYSEDMPSDVEIIDTGSGPGRGRKLPYPVGYRHGKKVTFHYPEIIERLVREGLRAK